MAVRVITLIACCLSWSCSAVTVQQGTVSTVDITARRPARPGTRATLASSSIELSEKIEFTNNGAEIASSSFALLDEVVQLLGQNPQIERVRIEAHTDNGGNAERNRELSRARAANVRSYLVSKGIAQDRLLAEGYGPDKPLADNGTAEGREKNRRLVFVIVRQSEKKSP